MDTNSTRSIIKISDESDVNEDEEEEAPPLVVDDNRLTQVKKSFGIVFVSDLYEINSNKSFNWSDKFWKHELVAFMLIIVSDNKVLSNKFVDLLNSFRTHSDSENKSISLYIFSFVFVSLLLVMVIFVVVTDCNNDRFKLSLLLRLYAWNDLGLDSRLANDNAILGFKEICLLPSEGVVVVVVIEVGVDLLACNLLSIFL